MRLVREKKLAVLVLAAGSIACPLVAHATTATWIGTAGEDWDASGAWNASEPNNVDDEAIFNTSGASAVLDIPVTLGILDFTANATISGSNTFTLETASATSPGVVPAVDLSGAGTTATISAPIDYLPNNSAVTPLLNFNGVSGSSGTTLNINGGLSFSGSVASFDSGTYDQGAASLISTSGTGGIFVGNNGGTAVLNVGDTLTDSGVLIVGTEETSGITPVGVGTLNQTSATTVTASGTVRIGLGFITGSASYILGTTASQGTYNISGGGSLVTTSGVGLVVGSSNGTGALNVSGASTSVTSGGEMTVELYAGAAPGLGGSGSVTLQDGTITANNTGTGTALAIGDVNPTAPSSILIDGSTSTSGGRLVVTTGALSIANATIGGASTTGDDAAGAIATFTIQNGGTAFVGGAMTVGSSIPSFGFTSPNSATVSISGTTPGSFSSKLSVGTSLNIGTSGGSGTFSANESDTVPITVGSASSAGLVNLGTGSYFSNEAGSVANGGNGTLNLSGLTVMNVNSNVAVATTVVAVGSSTANTLAVGTNLGSTGSATLSNNAVLNVNTTGNTSALNVVIGNGVANNQGDAGSGTLTMQNNSQLNLATGNLIVGSNEASGTLNIGGSADITLSSATASLVVGTHSNSSTGSPVASLLQSGTSLITAPSALIGNGVNGSATVSGGTLDATTGGITLGTSTGAAGTAATIGNGTLTVTGGTVETGGGGNVVLCAAASSFASEEGTLNLQGGLLSISGALQSNNTGVPANAVVNFTGGELQAATVTPTNFVSAVSQTALPVALQQTSNALVQTNTNGASLLHAATQNLTVSGGYVLLGGAAQADLGETISISGLTSIGSGTIQGAGTFSTSATNGFGINGTLTVAGPGIVNLNGPSLNQSTSALDVTGGTVNVSAASLPPPIVAISGTGLVHLATNETLGSQSENVPVTAPTSNVNITSLSITGGGTLDIGNNHIIINYGSGPDPISTIATLIADGAYGSGTTVTWTGTGIISTAAAANSLSYGIGYADAADAGNPAGLAPGQIEIMYTLLGDANLDGKVNGIDFNLMTTNFNQAVTDGWDKGDFNYDGKVNGIDFNLLAQNFNQLASQSADASADVTALDAFAAANGISLTSVPEPASISLLTLSVVGMLARRRRAKRTTA